MKLLVAVCAMFLGLSFAHANQNDKRDSAKQQTQESKYGSQEAMPRQGDKQDGVIKSKKATQERTDEKKSEDETSY